MVEWDDPSLRTAFATRHNFESYMIDPEHIRALLPSALTRTDLPLPGKRSGKVRDWYALGPERRLLVTTDRLSAFDRVLASVPYKGQALNQLAAWWFAKSSDIVPNHMLDVPDPNALVARVAQPFAVEVVVRGYITGEIGRAHV